MTQTEAAPLDSTGDAEPLLMDSPITLRYPNGRVHETTLSTSGELRPGDRFELYGRQWEAVRLLEPSRSRADEDRRMLCLSTSGLIVPSR
jgi:hypothetical protein